MLIHIELNSLEEYAQIFYLHAVALANMLYVV